MYHISVIGAGCVGSVIIERLQQKTIENVEVSIIAKGKRAERLKDNGIIVNGKQLQVKNASELENKIDLLFVCVKNYDLMQACKDIRLFIDDKTIILPLLNSISPTPTIQEQFPGNRVLYGYITKIDSHREHNGFAYNISGDIHFGYADNSEVAPELCEIKQLLNDVGFNASIDPDMRRGVWKKWMLNVGANQVSALTEADYLQFATIPEIEKVLRLAMQELLTIACYENVNLSTRDISDLIKYLTTYPFPKKTSMLQDILEHRQTEIDYISGDILKLSNKWNCPCPVNLTMYYLIKSKEKCYLL